MIQNAKNTPINANPGTLPNMGDTIVEWFQAMTFTRITKSILEFQVVESKEEIATRGVRQPFSAQQLAIKPENQRAWKWEMMHALPDVVLEIDDVVVFSSTSYRVMRRWDWREYGYVQYDIVQDYEAVSG